MGWLGKMVGGTIGLALGGPLGAIAGASLGHLMDADSSHQQQRVLPNSGKMSEQGRSQLTFFVAAFSMLAKLWPGPQSPMHTMPTGFSGLPPPGPAMPLTESP